ncbi:DeoR/GlpR family DNA-binding transcription regulator [soil metagenome]
MITNTEENVSRDLRRRKLAALVSTRGFVRVTDASFELGVSDVTIRGDLTALEAAGALLRVHGGAMPRGDREPSLESSIETAAAAKAAIGTAAAGLVASGQSIYVDAGSTAMALARALVDRHDLHDLVVVTSGLTIALALEPALPRFTVVVTGGTLRPLQHSLVNPFAAPMLDSLRLDVAFIGCNGIHPEHGVTNVNLPEAEIKTRVLQRSGRGVLLADASKLGNTEVAVIAPTAAFDTLVTAGEPPTGLVAGLRAQGMSVMLADSLDR